MTNKRHDRIGRFIAWSKFAIGLCMLLLMVTLFASGYTLPGVFGEVVRHNQATDIDASPLFYSEVENMSDLEDGVRVMMEQARSMPSSE
ncbi:MAG: hypothetical protein KKG33_02970 [candidate division Zixibacteria bacterium]|nr:hypothetical protein [candidate division Zixibacteria bacterium]MBU1470736.1 hypothetical protein [candidate division Zixibacteria bacterium]MBU2624504.1 hypothetical protein [candidate division Zixibacteria bacterium]